MKQRLAAMLDLQDVINARIDPNWTARDFAWYRAVWVECAELLDHYGWKWWKQQNPDIEQVKLELVDIWHFGLSLLLLQDVPRDRLIADLTLHFSESPAGEDFPAEVEHFALQVLATRDFDVGGFARLMATAGLDFSELYRRYVGKNVLNRFRQDHGYQDGSYRKLWQGREDNEHLVEVAAALDDASADFQHHVYQALLQRYRET